MALALETDNIVMKFGGVTAVNSLSMKVNEGEIVALIGPNGAGKTTAFNVITGVYAPTSGYVHFMHNDITGKSPDKITRLGVSRTFQNIRLFKELTVLENVMIANHLHVKSSFLSATLRLPWAYAEEKEIREKSLHLLEKQDLINYKDDIASSLPYGKQRRLEIARALATNPRLLLLDEPAAGMNPQETIELTDFIAKVKDEYNLSVFMIEHHMELVMGISDRIYVLDFGQLIAEGAPAEIQQNSRVIEAYLGVDEDA